MVGPRSENLVKPLTKVHYTYLNHSLIFRDGLGMELILLFNLIRLFSSVVRQ